MTRILLDNIKKAYGDTVIMEDMSFSVEEGERLVLLGPSGCGKSTILRMIAGFEEITDGNLMFDEQKVNEVAPGDRNVAMVFQNYALYPHMNVYDNITYGLKVNKVPKDRIDNRVNEVVEALDLEKYLQRKPAELSGGQRQRVALARATVKDSDVFLLDEPLSNLDAKLRVSARESLVDIHRRYRQTMIYVTHDQIEAMTFADRIALLNFGELQQIDTPENIYHTPANIFTACFIGNPPMNIFDNSSYKDGRLYIHEQSAPLAPEWVEFIEAGNYTNLKVGVRPEAIKVTVNPSETTFTGVVSHIENQGANYANYVDIAGETMVVLTQIRLADPGDPIYMEFEKYDLHFFDVDTTNSIGYPENILNAKRLSAGQKPLPINARD
ncbi:ABC transporter, ATP-binding protein [Aerococcus sp. Group 1]|uniref:ABC transporter ATP-binding protein n=1 Tax=Aerococcus urinae (strain CCUG 59500 / ACS-120-V-Col10a) TaxID=2976812 RepID=UPI000200F883|nr:ABC transporter ATP-binding protein [Aerococcus sp. Group 1]AEA01537.1 ABC transporter, ATP-binding protein [Aerococcus sp. Group 1]